MEDYARDDTIVAISTPLGFGGIGIVRLSGNEALEIARKIFIFTTAKTTIIPQRAVFGHLVEIGGGERLDDGYLIYFRGPHSYTKEDVVELSLHGSPAVLEGALRSSIKAGARAAHPGEFTLRAFLNGRFDIIQAEAVNDLIHATSLEAAKLAFGQIDGRLSMKIWELRRRMVRLQADIEALIEFPEECLPVSSQKISRSLATIVRFLENLVSSYNAGKALFEGVTLAIVGKTNVGKSTLFNAILEEDRAIVTPYPGTTRDFLRERVRIRDAYFTLVDMAGLAKSRAKVEKEGIERGKRLAAQADGLLIILDISRKESRQDQTLLEACRDRNALVVFNKIDLPRKMDTRRIKRWSGRLPSVEISALKGNNIGFLKAEIYRLFAVKLKNPESTIFHLRQKTELESILKHCLNARDRLAMTSSEEICAEEMRDAIQGMGRLTGDIRTDEVLEDIFSRFCVGK